MKHQGDSAELRFMLLNHLLGHTIAKPFGDNAKYDLIVEIDNKLERIQVKSTSRKDNLTGVYCYCCIVCSGASVKKMYSEDDIDFIAIYVIPEDAWYKIPVKEIKSKKIRLYPHRTPKKNSFEKYRIK